MASIRKNTLVKLTGENVHSDALKVSSMSADGNWARVTLPNGMVSNWHHVSTLTVVPVKRVRKSRAKVAAVEAAAE
jgi:hypothetical protein